MYIQTKVNELHKMIQNAFRKYTHTNIRYTFSFPSSTKTPFVLLFTLNEGRDAMLFMDVTRYIINDVFFYASSVRCM
jgi:hypothetical protein